MVSDIDYDLATGPVKSRSVANATAVFWPSENELGIEINHLCFEYLWTVMDPKTGTYSLLNGHQESIGYL
ncbi:hypothetical protein [Halorientalis sp. IM1011]|uniref:hypothetical protein n=1 Tax=Halorientalis sp. IM1011 TaxID=1932360 RepID=UPI0012FA2186|nr:hypothetical protein [Halorientalis sp. IM1011]